MPLNLRYPNIVKIGNDEITDESRAPLTEDRDERSVIVDLASGKKKKFVKSVRRTWSISWDNVAANASETVDGKGGRDELRSIAEGAGFITLLIQDGRNPTETYTVHVTSYNEEVLQRRGDGGFRYKVSIELEEQG
jgi:hypothetical protein